MKGEVTDISRFFDEIEMKYKWMIVTVTEEKPKIQMGKCTIEGIEK